MQLLYGKLKQAENERKHISPQERGWQQWRQTHMDHPQRI